MEHDLIKQVEPERAKQIDADGEADRARKG
jgi:hypothetical protein